MSEYLRNISVMLVEDQDFSAKLLRQMLKVLGCTQVSVFDNGEDAWAFYKRNPADLVITDWQMAPVDGIQLTKLIRKSEDSPNTFVPIIIVTAFREKEHVLQARDAGVTEYVVKPVSPKGLFSRIEAVIERPRRFVRVGEFFGPDRRRHKGEYTGLEKRGQAKPPQSAEEAARAAKERKREMQQDEIDKTFNPDEAADGK